MRNNVSESQIIRIWQHQLMDRADLVNSAQRQQGLIHIYNTLCSQGNCPGCPLPE